MLLFISQKLTEYVIFQFQSCEITRVILFQLVAEKKCMSISQINCKLRAATGR